MKKVLLILWMLLVPGLAMAQTSGPPIEDDGEGIAAILDDALTTEKRDAEWADQVERAAREALIELASQGVSLRETVCGTTFCRAVLDFESLSRSEHLLEDLTFKAPFNVGGWARLHDDGQTVSLYFQREGYALPDLSSLNIQK